MPTTDSSQMENTPQSANTPQPRKGMADWTYDVQKGSEPDYRVEQKALTGLPEPFTPQTYDSGSSKDKKISRVDLMAERAAANSGGPKTSYLRSDFYGDPNRFDEMRPFEDNQTLEDRAYASQGTGERAVKSVANMVNGFTKTVVEGVTAPLVGLGYMIGEGKGSAFYDNPYNKALEKWKGFDIYESSKRKAAAWYSPDYWMSMNTLNSTLSTVGDLAGFAVLGLFAEATAGAALATLGRGLEATLGGGAEFEKSLQAIADMKAPLPKIGDNLMGAEYNKAIQGTADIVAGLPEGEKGQAAIKEFTEGLERIKSSGMDAASSKTAQDKLITEISKKYVGKQEGFIVKNFDKVQRATVGIVTNLGMAQSSAYQTSTNFREKMIEQIKSQGRIPTKEEMDKIDEAASGLGGYTGALMTIMGAVTLHGAWNGLLAKKDGEQFIRNGINEVINAETKEVEGLGKVSQIAAKEGEAVEEKVVSPEYTAKKADIEARRTEELSKAEATKHEEINAKYNEELKAIEIPETVKAPRTVSSTVKSIGKTVWKNASFAPGFGFLEFGLAPASVQSYYEKKYETKKDDFFSDISMMADALGSNVKGMFTKEGVTSFILGTFTGSLMHQFTGAAGIEKMQEAQREGNTNLAIDSYNSTYLRSVTKAMVDSARRTGPLRKVYLDAIRSGDKEAEMTLRQHQMENYLFPRIKYGLKSFVNKDISTERNMAATDEGMKDLQSLGIVPAEGDIAELRKEYLKHLDDIQEYANNAETYYKALTLKYGAVLNENGTRRYGDEHIEKLMFLSGGIDDITKRSKELSEDIQKSEIAKDPALMKRFTDLLRKFEAYQDEDVKKSQGRIDKAETDKLFAEIDKLAMNPDKKEDLAKKFGDMLKLKVRQRQYLNEYKKIVSNPELYSDNLREIVADSTPQGDTITGNYVKEVRVANKTGKMDLKIGETYFAGSKIVPGVGAEGKVEGFRSFVKFTVLGEKTVGEGDAAKRMITIRTDEGEQDIPEEVFAKYKLGAESTLNKPENRNAKYFFDNINTKYDYNYGKKKGGLVEGRLDYDPDEDQFYFVPDEATGNKRIPIEKADFRKQAIRDKKGNVVRRSPERDENGKLVEGEVVYYDEPRIKAKGKVEKASEDWLAAKETEKETARREELILNRMEAVDTILEKKKKLLSEAKDNLIENKLKLEDVQAAMKKAEDGVKKSPTGTDADGQMKKRHWLGTSVGTIRELTKVIRDTQSDIDKIQEQIDNLEEQIDYFEKYDVEGLPSGKQLLNFIDDTRLDLMLAKEDAEKKIKTLSDFIVSTGQVIKDSTKRFMSYVDTFKMKYPEYAINTDRLEDFAKALETDIDLGKMMVGEEGNEYISDLQDMKKQIMDLEEMNIGIKKSDMEKAINEIEELGKQIEDINKEMKLQDQLYDSFKAKWDAFMKEKTRRELFNSPAFRERFAAIQGRLNNGEEARGINNDKPQGWQSDIKKNWKSAAKSVWTVFRSSVLPSHDQRPKDGWPKDSFPAQYNNWADRYNEFMRNSNLGFPRPKGANPEEYIPADAKTLVVFITKNNQHNYFDGEFIPETYKGSKGDVNNAKDAKDASIAFAHVYYDEKAGKAYFIDKEGKILKEVGDKSMSPNEAVFSFMETADLERNANTSAGREKFNADEADASQIEALQKEAEEMRGKMLERTDMSGYYDYSESRGIPNDVEGEPQKNSVSATKLGDNTRLQGTISLSVLPSEGKGVGAIAAGDKVLNFPVGYPIFVYNNNVAFLNGQRFGEALGRVDHLLKVIKAMADSYYKDATGDINSTFTDYLSSVLFFSNKVHKETGIANNQLYFYDNPDMGKVLGFRIGDEKKPTLIRFTPEDIADNETLLKSWLGNAFHSVSSKALKESEKGNKYNEITGIDEKGQPIIKTWNSYEQYLLSDEDGRKNVPMTVNLKIPEAHEGPLVNKYVMPDFNDEYFPLRKPAPTQKESEIKSSEPAETTVAGKLPESGTANFTVDGKTYKAEYKTINESGSFEIDNLKIYDDAGKLLSPLFNAAIIKNISAQITDSVNSKPEVKKPEGDTSISGKEQVSTSDTSEKIFAPGIPKLGTKEFTLQGKKYKAVYKAGVTDGELQMSSLKIYDESGKEFNRISAIDLYREVGKELLSAIQSKPIDSTKPAEPVIIKAPTIVPETAAKPEVKPEAAPVSNPEEFVPGIVLALDPKITNKIADDISMDADPDMAGADLMQVVPSETYEPGDRAGEKEFIEATIPQIRYEETPDVIKTGNGIYAYGKYEKHLIQIWRDAPKGAGYHEHYHAVEDGFLTDKELDELRAEFRGRKDKLYLKDSEGKPILDENGKAKYIEGAFVDRFGRTIKFSEATEYDRRERMAEEWREFKNNNPEFTRPSKATNFFRRLANFIKHFVFGDKLTKQEFFKRMNASYYRDSKVIVRTSDEPLLMGIEGLSEVEKKAVIHGIAWKIVDNLRNTTGGLIKVGEGTIISDMFDPVYNWMKDKYTNIYAPGNIANIRAAEIKNALTPEQYKKLEESSPKNPDTGKPRINWGTESIMKIEGLSDIQKDKIKQADDRYKSTFSTWIKITKEDGTGFKPEVMNTLKDFFKKYKIVFDKKLSKKMAKRAIEEALAEDMINKEETHHSENQEVADYHVEEVKDRGYDVEYMRVDAIGGAPIEVRLLFAFAPQPREEAPNVNVNKRFGLEKLDNERVPSQLSHMQLPTLVDSRKLMVKVLNGLAGVTNKKDMQRRLFDMATKDPSLVRVYNAVYKDWSSCSLDDVRLRVSFTKWASKMKPQYLAMKLDEDGRTYMINSNVDTDAKLIRSEWFSNIRNSPILAEIDYANGAYMLNKAAIKSVDVTNQASVVDFLKSIHLPVTNELFNKLSKAEGAELMVAAGKVHSLLKAGTYVTKDSFDMTGPMNTLTNLLAKAEHLRMPTSHRNLDGNSVQNHIMFNGINRMVQSVIHSGSLNNLRKEQPRLFADTWSKNSYWLEEGGPIFDEKGNVRSEVKDDERFAMTITEGLINEMTDNTPAKGMNRATRFMSMFNMLLGKKGSGVFYNFIPADSSSETGLRAPHFITKAEFKAGNYKAKVEKRVIQYLKDEIDLIDENKNGKRIVTKAAKKHGDKLQIFNEILKNASKSLGDNTDLLKVITDFAKNKNGKTNEEFFKEIVNGKTIEDRVTEAFWADREKKVQKQLDFLKDRKIIQDIGDEKYKWYNINSEFIEDMGYSDRLSEKEIKNVLGYGDMNLFVHNTELRKMFYGPWYEVPDQTKRDKLYQSGTESTYVDDGEFNQWYRNTQNTVGGVKLQEGDFNYHSVSNTMDQVTFNHDKGIRSRHYEQIREKLVKKFGEKVGNKLADKYKAIEEMDAQGIVRSTSWKEYVLRSGDQWTEEDEAQDQYDNAMAILADADGRNGRTKPKTLRPELREACEEIIKKGDPKTWATGQPKKPLGVGMVKNDSQNIPFSNKTSIMRLSYSVAKGRELEDLFWWMHDNNVSYCGPQSAEKTGKLADLPDLYKTENGKTSFNLSSLSSEQVNKIKKSVGWEDFNKIVETAKSKTGKTLGSQLQSIIVANAMADEMPTDFYDQDVHDYDTKKAEWDALDTEDKKRAASEKYALHQDNNRAIAELSTRGAQRVLDNLGIKEVIDSNGNVIDYELVNPQKVVDFLKDEITKRDLPDNLSDALNWVHNTETGKDELLYDIHTLPNYQELTNIIWSHVQNNVISSKMNGTDNILVSAALWEKKGMRETTTADGKSVISSSTLKFYEPDQVDPITKKKGTSLMEVYAPNHFRKSLDQWAERTGKELPSDEEMFEYLNNTENGQKLLTAIGFRTPTQGMNSVDAVRIVPFDKESGQMFLPASMGDSVVVPSELVAKAGIDFDVDKMGTYHYNFEIDDKGFPRYIEFKNDTNSTAEERYIDYISEHPENKGDMKALEAGSEFQDVEGMFTEKGREEAQKLYKKSSDVVNSIRDEVKAEKQNYREQIESIRGEVTSQYQYGKELFNKLPQGLKQLYWNREADLNEGRSSKIKGIEKTMIYDAFTEQLINAIKEGTPESSETIGEIIPVLEAMRSNYRDVMSYNSWTNENIENYKLFRDKINAVMSDKISNVFAELSGKQKSAFKSVFKGEEFRKAIDEVRFEAAKIVAEARGLKDFDSFSKGDMFSQNSEKALQNKYFETLERLVRLPDNYEQLITPNSSDELIAIKDRIRNLMEGKEGSEDRGKQEFDYANMTDAMWLSNERQDFLDAKGNSVGIAAVGNTSHIQSQAKLTEIKDNGRATEKEREFLGDFKVYLPHRQLKTGGRMITTFSGMKNSVGTYISDFISQLINGAVDVVKDKWLIEIVGNKDTLSTCIFLGRCAVDPKYVFTFINQPVIQEYIKQSEIKKTLKGFDKDADTRTRDQVIAEVVNATYKDLTIEEKTRNRGDLPEGEQMFKIQDLEQMLLKSGQGKKMREMNEEEREMQRQIFNEFLKYKTFADNGALREQMGNFINNMKGVTDETISLKEERNKVAREKGLIGTSNSMFADSNNLQNVMLNNVLAVRKAVRKILPLSASPVLERMGKVFTNMDLYLSDDKRKQVLDKMMSSYIDFGVQIFGEREFKPLNRSITELLIDQKSNTAAMLSNFRRDKNIPGDVKNLITKALDRLAVKVGANVDGVKNIEIVGKPNTAMESNEMTEAFRELRDNPHTSDLYSRLVYTALLQSGVRDGRNSYAKYIPHEDWVKFVKPVVDMLKDDNGMIGKMFEDNMAFYRNNYRDNDIVPKLKKFWRGNVYDYPRYYDANIDNYMNAVLTQPQYKNAGLAKPYMMTVTDGYSDSKYPVVKITEIVNKPDGTPYTKYEKAQMAKKRDYSFTRTRIFKKVLDVNGEPYVVKTYKGKAVFLYKEINAWGDGYGLQEYYQEGRPSALNRGHAVPELLDQWIIDATTSEPGKLRTIGEIPLPKMEQEAPKITETEKKAVSTEDTTVKPIEPSKPTTSGLSGLAAARAKNNEKGNEPDGCNL